MKFSTREIHKNEQTRLIIAASNTNINIMTNSKTAKSGRQKWAEKQPLNTSSDKLGRLYT